MEVLYNPGLMDKETIKATFAAKDRENFVNDLIKAINEPSSTKKHKHILIQGPRGIGKTTILLKLNIEVEERLLNWQVVRFPEETYAISTEVDFWNEILVYIIRVTSDHSLNQRVKHLLGKLSHIDGYDGQSFFDLLKEWCGTNKKHILLLVDNIDILFSQITTEIDLIRLKNILQQEIIITMVGTSLGNIAEIVVDKTPISEIFEIRKLDNLNFDQMKQLILKRVDVNSNMNRAESNKLRALYHFSGGNPRYILMLYPAIIKNDFSDLRLYLEKILDQLTPYFKTKVESLTPQLRKILDSLAQLTTSETHEGRTPSQIANQIRISPTQASVQLSRLSNLGYVKVANMSGRNSYYVLSEPTFALWYQMRFFANSGEKRSWIISIAEALYKNLEDLDKDAGPIKTKEKEILDDSSTYLNIVKNKLELDDSSTYLNIVKNKLELDDSSTYLNIVKNKLELKDAIELASNKETYEQALFKCDEIVRRDKNFLEAWFVSAVILVRLERYEETITSCSKVLELEQSDHLNDWPTLSIQAIAQFKLEKYDEALNTYNKLLKLAPNKGIKGTDHSNWGGWLNRVVAQMTVQPDEEPIENLDNELSIEPGDLAGYLGKIVILARLEKYQEIIVCCKSEIAHEPNNWKAWINQALAFMNLQNYKEALKVCDQGIKATDTKSKWRCWFLKAEVLKKDKKYDRAEKIFKEELNEISYSGIQNSYRYVFLMNCAVKVAHVNTSDIDSTFWRKAVDFASRIIKEEGIYKSLLFVLVQIVQAGQIGFVRELISELKIELEVLPLTHAIDFYLTKDKNLIEKLSPEIKNLTEEYIEQFKEIVNETVQSKKKEPTKDKFKGKVRRYNSKQAKQL